MYPSCLKTWGRLKQNLGWPMTCPLFNCLTLCSVLLIFCLQTSMPLDLTAPCQSLLGIKSIQASLESGGICEICLRALTGTSVSSAADVCGRSLSPRSRTSKPGNLWQWPDPGHMERIHSLPCMLSQSKEEKLWRASGLFPKHNQPLCTPA